MLQKSHDARAKMKVKSDTLANGITDSPGNVVQQTHGDVNLDVKLHDLAPRPLQALHELVSLVHDGVNATNLQNTSTSDRGVSDGDCKDTAIATSCCLNDSCQQYQCTSTSDSGVFSVKDSKNMLRTNLYHLEDDSIANIIWSLEPLDLLNSFLAMVHSFPRTLEALILHMLSPVGAEVLTRKFEELDQQLTEEDRSKFYQRFYSVFDDQFAIMDAILKGKESFALQAFKNVLQLYMGVTFSGPSYTL